MSYGAFREQLEWGLYHQTPKWIVTLFAQWPYGKVLYFVLDVTDGRGDISSVCIVLDACVLFPGSLRDVLLRGAEEELYGLCLTDQILEEMRRNLVEKGHATEEGGQRLVRQIKEHFPTSFITNHMLLVSTMPINEKDRHVLAAAVASRSKIIVTQNLRDFPWSLLEPFGVEPLSADDFLVRCFSQDSGAMMNLVRSYVRDLKRPPLTMQEALGKLGKLVPNFVRLIQEELCI